MNMADEKLIKVRMDDESLLARWREILEARQISQQRAMVALIRWIVGEEPITQAMIFGQVPETDFAELSRIVVRRLGSKTPTYEKLVGSDYKPGDKSPKRRGKPGQN